MDVIQGFTVLAAVFVAAVIIVTNHYRHYDLLERTRKLEDSLQNYEIMMLGAKESAATKESAVTEEVVDSIESEKNFIELTERRLSVDNVYDICLSNLRMLNEEQKLILRSVDSSTDYEAISAILTALEDHNIIHITESGVYMTKAYIKTFYRRLDLSDSTEK